MLDFVRKHSKSWIIKVALGLIVLVFIFWGGYSYTSRHASDIAQVGDHVITAGEYNTAYRNMVEAYKRQLGPAFSDDLIKQLNLKEVVLESIVRQYLVLKGAEDLGLAATDDEIKATIAATPAFQTDGRFDKKRYESLLRSSQYSPEKYEEEMRLQLTQNKVHSFIIGRALVTPEEVAAEHHFERDRIKVAYVPFDPKSFEDKVSVKDDDLKAYYEKNQRRYMEPEKREIAYVLLNTEEMSKDMQATDAEVKQYYDDNVRQFAHEEEVHARHILFKLKPDAPQAEVDKARAEAQKVLDEAKKGKDFTELAKKYSQDEMTAKKGGDLGFFTAKTMEPAFSKAAFDLKPGQVSDIVRTPYGFHIIKVEEVHPARTAPLEEVKADIEQKIKLQKAQDAAYKKIRDLRDQAYARKDIDKAAQELKLTVTGPVWIEMAADLPDSGPFPKQIKAKLFDLGEGDVSDILEPASGLAVVQLKSIKRPQAIPFETAKEKVTKDYRAEQAKVLAEKKAAEVLALAKDKKSLADAAKAQNLSVRQSDFFSRQDPDKDLKLLRGESLNKIFGLKEASPFPDAPLELGNRYVVCQFAGSNPAAAPTAEESTAISGRLLRQKQQAVWEAWLSDMRKNVKFDRFREI